MAKVRKIEAVKTSITEAELVAIRDAVNKVNKVQMQIGGIEAHKQDLLAALKLASLDLQNTQESLREIYGDVNIDLTTGEFADADNKEN
jgi:allophanate hydrolase subunit 1